MSGDGAFGKLRIRDYWCSGSQGWKSVKCVPVTVFWEVKDCILPLDSPYSYLLRASGSGERWARSLWRLRVCLYSSELKLSCSSAGLCTVFPVGKMKSLLQQVLNPTSTYWASTMSQAHPSNQSYAAPYLLHHQILMELFLVTQDSVGLYNEKRKCGLQLWLPWESWPRGTGMCPQRERRRKTVQGAARSSGDMRDFWECRAGELVMAALLLTSLSSTFLSSLPPLPCGSPGSTWERTFRGTSAPIRTQDHMWSGRVLLLPRVPRCFVLCTLWSLFYQNE